MGQKERQRERPKHEVAEVIRKFERAYLEKYRYTFAQKCVVNNILRCRTAALGGHIRACKQCGKTEIAYNPCKDRQCPKCGAYDKAQWLEEQKIWALPTYYYHLIFTIDHVFNPVVWENQGSLGFRMELPIYGGAPIRQTCDSLQDQGRDAETKLCFGEYRNNVA